MKQETLEEAMERLSNIVGVGGISDKHAFMLGTFWQRERMYSEEDLKEAFAMGRLNKSIKDFNQRFKNK
jgi:hypothetical protein